MTDQISLTSSHCVLLEHYYSVDFPWWFDRKNWFTKTANKMTMVKKELLNGKNLKLRILSVFGSNSNCVSAKSAHLEAAYLKVLMYSSWFHKILVISVKSLIVRAHLVTILEPYFYSFPPNSMQVPSKQWPPTIRAWRLPKEWGKYFHKTDWLTDSDCEFWVKLRQ